MATTKDGESRCQRSNPRIGPVANIDFLRVLTRGDARRLHDIAYRAWLAVAPVAALYVPIAAA